MSGYNTWQHTTCFEVWHGGDCCGCCDRGPCYILQNAFCAPCSFGRLAEKGANYNCASCCICFSFGALAGGVAFGAPVLPCAVNVRRKLVNKYGIDESCLCSMLHVICCPGVSLLQMLMEVEDQENGRVRCAGDWHSGPGQKDVFVTYEPMHR